MKIERHLIILIIIISSLFGCRNINIKEIETAFESEYLKSNLLSHFPEKIKDNKKFRMSSFPPYCPPSYECRAQFGKVYLIDKRDASMENGFINSCLYHTAYSDDSLIIINQIGLRKELFTEEKYNKAFKHRYPIPYFENYDFKLGEKTSTEVIEGEKHVNYIYTIPNDLEVYVLEAEAGNFWKENCNENRPESLKEWKHGYSKGIATSATEKLIIYWTMIW